MHCNFQISLVPPTYSDRNSCLQKQLQPVARRERRWYLLQIHLVPSQTSSPFVHSTDRYGGLLPLQAESAGTIIFYSEDVSEDYNASLETQSLFSIHLYLDSDACSQNLIHASQTFSCYNSSEVLWLTLRFLLSLLLSLVLL